MKQQLIISVSGIIVGLILAGVSILTVYAMSCLSGCGGSGGKGGEPSDMPTSQTITCSHNGDVWLCNEDNSCVRDESVEEVVGETEKGLMARFVSGNITIIAECGSHVTFVSSEETSSDDDQVTTAATVNVGVNGAAN